MKGIIPLLAAGILLIGAIAPLKMNGQATLIDAPDTVFVSLDTLTSSSAVVAHWDVVNETETALNLMVTRSLISTVTPFNYPYEPGNPGSYERFCWGPSCFNYGDDASSPISNVFLNPGDTTSTFVCDFYPNNVPGASTIRYCFHEPGAISSGVCHTITFMVLGTAGIDEAVAMRPALAGMSPNPAGDEVLLTFNDSRNGVLEFRNLIGQVCRTEQVVQGLTEQRVSLDDMTDGVWLVTYSVDGTAVSSKRLVIR